MGVQGLETFLKSEIKDGFKAVSVLLEIKQFER
jgi:hypothetical protein